MGVDQRGIIKPPKALVPGSGRPEPPQMNAEAAKFWREFVAAMPDGWFGPEVQPLLRTLCMHMATSRWLERRIAEHQHDENLDKLDQCTEMLARESKIIGELSSKLRLTPKSKWGQEQASTKQALAPKRRPWANAS